MRWRPKAYPVRGQTKFDQLEYLASVVGVCVNCPNLASTRLQTVFGEGNPDAALMFVGEAPGVNEDAQGRPFVGRAGQFLDRVIANMNLVREEVYIANILKCRPDTPSGTGDRPPSTVEMRDCLPYLYAQIGIIQPRAVLAMGNTAVDALFSDGEPYKRGFVYEFEGIPVVVTYHPAYVLRNPTEQVRTNFWTHALSALELSGTEVTDEIIARIPTEADTI